jgi:hypothetical protein
MKELYDAPSLQLVRLQSAQSLTNSDIPFNDLKDDPEYVDPKSFPLGDSEVDIPIN